MALDVPEKQDPIPVPEDDSIILPRLLNPHEPKAEPKPITIDAANITSFWALSKWWFFEKQTDGYFYVVYAAEFVIDAHLDVIMFMYSGQTDDSGCTESVRNDLHGKLIVHPATPSTHYPWLAFEVAGEQTWTYTCPPPGSKKTYPLSGGTWAWIAKPLNPYGTRFEFYNFNYKPWTRDFVVQRIR